MASHNYKQIFLVALLLTIALIGSHAGSDSKRCKTTGECPACGLGGTPWFLDGVCACFRGQDSGCTKNSDCIKFCGEDAPTYASLYGQCDCP